MPAGVHTFKKFSAKKRLAYLDLLRQGNHRTTSARGVGVSYVLVCLYRRAHPHFAELEEQAEMEANGEVENALFKAAIKGNVTACQVWLYNRTPDRWKDQRNLKVTGLDDVLGQFPPELARELRKLLAQPVPGGSGSAAAGANGHGDRAVSG